MKHLIESIKNILGFRNDFKNDYIHCIEYGIGVTWVVNDLSDERKKWFFRVIWRTKDTGWYANETLVWAVSEEDVKRVMMKKYRLKEKDFEEFRVFKIYPKDNPSLKTPEMSWMEYRELLWQKGEY